MSSMNYIVICLSILLLPFKATAQENCNCSSEEDYQAALLNGLISIEYSNQVAGYEGDQFLRDWAYGEVKLKNGTVIKNIILRYDRYLDDVLYLRPHDYRKGILNKSEIAEFALYEDGPYPSALYVKKRIRLPYLDTTEVFVHNLVKGKLELFAFRNVKVEPVANRLYDNTKLVLSTKENDYLIRLRRKNLLEIPVIDKVEMKKLLRRNHISIRDNEQGMAMAIRYYNQL